MKQTIAMRMHHALTGQPALSSIQERILDYSHLLIDFEEAEEPEALARNTVFALPSSIKSGFSERLHRKSYNWYESLAELPAY